MSRVLLGLYALFCAAFWYFTLTALESVSNEFFVGGAVLFWIAGPAFMLLGMWWLMKPLALIAYPIGSTEFLVLFESTGGHLERISSFEWLIIFDWMLCFASGVWAILYVYSPQQFGLKEKRKSQNTEARGNALR